MEGGEPGTMRSLIGSVYEFEGELYAYNFDHAFGGEAQAFVGILQQLTGSGAKASDYLSYMYNSLHNPQKVWKLNDATGKFEELTAFTKLMEGTTNEYIWRMGSHNGKLYVATMDAGIFYNYMTQLTNGSFFKMSNAERLTKIAYLGNVVKLLGMAKGNEKADELRTKLEELQQLLSQYVQTEQVDEDTVETIIDIQGITQELNSLVAAFLQQQTSQQMATLTAMLVQALENAKAKGQTDLTALMGLLEYLGSEEVREQWAQQKEQLEQATPEERREFFNTAVQKTLSMLFGQIKNMNADIYERIDGKGLEMYDYINKAVMTNEWGFDLLRTADGGQSFEVITRSGFNDKYNYGCPSFLSTEEGLYFGTCNPFYGGQLYLLSEKDETITGISEIGSETVTPATTGYYTLNGQAVKGVPTSKGVYIKDGRKVLVGVK